MPRLLPPPKPAIQALPPFPALPATAVVQPRGDAELAELDRHLAKALRDRHREFAASQEARRFAGDGGEVRFGENAEQAGALERFDRSVGLT